MAGFRVPRRAVPVGLGKAHRAEAETSDGQVAAKIELAGHCLSSCEG